MNTERTLRPIPADLELKIIRSKFDSLSQILTTGSYIFLFIVFAFLVAQANGGAGFANEVLGWSYKTVMFFSIGLLVTSLALYLGYRLNKMYLTIGSVKISCDTDSISIDQNGSKAAQSISGLKRIIYDALAVKGQMCSRSVNSSGAHNFISLESEGESETYEVLIELKEQDDILKSIVYYHTITHRK